MCFWVKKLPHPEESENPSQTIDNVDVESVLTKWLTDWKVPPEFWEYWRNKVVVKLNPDLVVNGQITPACAYELNGIRYIDVRPSWLNPGVIAHEACHLSYALLTVAQKVTFGFVYIPLATSDRLIRFLYSKNPYGLSSNIEGHAELYRFLAQSMPKVLQSYYPKLLQL